MKLFQKAYDFFKNLTLPAWLKVIMQDLNDLIIALLMQIGRDYINQMKEKIIEVSGMHISNDEKFQIVFDFTKTLTISLKDSTINLLIELLVSQLKKRNVI